MTVTATIRPAGPWYYVDLSTAEEDALIEARKKAIHGGTWWWALQRSLGRVTWNEGTDRIRAARLERKRREVAQRGRAPV